VIVVWGADDDTPVPCVAAALAEAGADVVRLTDGDLATMAYDVTLAGTPSGWFEVGGRRVDLGGVRGAYLRPGRPAEGRATEASAALLAAFAALPATVVNRPSAGRSNWSKPFQLGLLAKAGFAVPETLVTTDPAAARAFLAAHGRVVYKSVSGVRSVVAALGPGDAARLDGVRTGPVQLQRWVGGLDVRVHVVGGAWFATAVESDAVDYRYAARDGADVTLAPYDLPDDVGRRVADTARAMGLLVAGADLRLGTDGEWYAFEVNPSPGFTFYEEATGQPIAAAVARLLVGGG
jgi:glutathione synthase/RimK-type ligase-like ATP-grasp enzyme